MQSGSVYFFAKTKAEGKRFAYLRLFVKHTTFAKNAKKQRRIADFQIQNCDSDTDWHTSAADGLTYPFSGAAAADQGAAHAAFDLYCL